MLPPCRWLPLRVHALHASWVIQIEIWSSILTRRVLRYGSFASATEITVWFFIAHWDTHELTLFAGTLAETAAVTPLSTIAPMARTFAVEDHHGDEVREHLAKYDGLEHVRARRRADLLTLESGPVGDIIPHTRFRRVGVHKWQSEMPLRGVVGTARLSERVSSRHSTS